MTTVIVQPDSAAAWIGLAGVALGAVLSAGGTWLQRRWTEQRARRHEVDEAAGELRAAARTLVLIVEAYHVKEDAQSLLAWAPLVSAQVERVEKATEVIGRHATPELAALAGAVAEAVVVSAMGDAKRKIGVYEALDEVNEAMKAFTAEARKAQA
jgi:hypothetical protein